MSNTQHRTRRPKPQPVLFTSYYANRHISNDHVIPVQISQGMPRFRIYYHIEARLLELAPPKDLLYSEGLTDHQWDRSYLQHLDEIGIAHVRKAFRELHDPVRPIVLLCFEDLLRPGKMFCHRRLFARWFKRQTGEKVFEYTPQRRKRLVPRLRDLLAD